MSQDRLIGLECSECKNINYHTKKSKLVKERLLVNKFCRHCKKHQPHKENKLK